MVDENILKKLHLDFIDRQQPVMWDFAQKNNTERGAILIYLSMNPPKNQDGFIYPSVYATLKETMNLQFPEETMNMIEGYDLKKEMILVFIDTHNDRIDGYKILGKDKNKSRKIDVTELREMHQNLIRSGGFAM